MNPPEVQTPNELENTLGGQFANSMTAVATMILLYGFVFDTTDPQISIESKRNLVRFTGLIAVAFSVNALWVYTVRALRFVDDETTPNKVTEHIHIYCVIGIGCAFTLLQILVVFAVLKKLNFR